MGAPLGEQTQRDLDRRNFLLWAGRKGLVVTAAGVGLPALLAACGTDEENTGAAPKAAAAADTEVEGTPLVGDVIDFALTSNEWQGAFGFVTLRLHAGIAEGQDVFFIRTDSSDQDFAGSEALVFAPKLGGLLKTGRSGSAYAIENGVPDQPTVLSSDPSRPDYTPAWRVLRGRWTKKPRLLKSVAEVEAAERSGDLSLQTTKIIVNGPIVKWSGGELPVDSALKDYLGEGQLIEAPDTAGMQVTFKLHECFPRARYIVVDTSMPPMAEGMQIFASPQLAGAPEAKATGRTNVFMNGIKGSGPMGFQPSVFDSQAGEPEWSPYWDHFTYAWKKENQARVLATQDEVHAARDAGELEEFPGTPDTKGAIFTVNCPVPVLAPNTFKA
jgi:hypothetical protein